MNPSVVIALMVLVEVCIIRSGLAYLQNVDLYIQDDQPDDLDTLRGSGKADNLTEEQERLIIALGMEVDYTFNETRSETDDSNKIISASGCPKSERSVTGEDHPFNRYSWVHYGNPPRCFLVGTKGPCPSGMRIGVQANSTFGICKCHCYFMQYDNPKLAIDPYLDTKKKFCFDGLSHHAFVKDKCYTLLTRGPCGIDEVLLMDMERNKPVCRRRECRAASVSKNISERNRYATLYNGTCLKLGDLCEEKSLSFSKCPVVEKFSVIEILRDNPNPTCVPHINSALNESYCDSLTSPLPPKNEYQDEIEYQNEYQDRITLGGSTINRSDCKNADQMYSVILSRCLPVTNSTNRKHQVG